MDDSQFVDVGRHVVGAMLDGMIDMRSRDVPMPPEVEAVGWLFAEKLSLIDSIGGMEWRRRIADGEVSAEAADVLRKAGVEGAVPDAWAGAVG